MNELGLSIIVNIEKLWLFVYTFFLENDIEAGIHSMDLDSTNTQFIIRNAKIKQKL